MPNQVRWVLLSVALLCGWCASRCVAQTIIYVRAGAPAGGNGQSWTTAFNDLQAGLGAAAAIAPDSRNVELWVAAGTYRPAQPGGPRSARFNVSRGMTLLGGFAGNESAAEQRNPAINTTVLSGDLDGDDAPGFQNRADNVYHVLWLSDTQAAATLDGFTITGGHANASTYPDSAGGGLLADLNNGGYTITRCVFTGNWAQTYGSAAELRATAGPEMISECRFIANRAHWPNDGSAGTVTVQGGSHEQLRIESCLFSGNDAARGGALAIGNTNPGGVLVQNCTFIFNRAVGSSCCHQGRGAAIYTFEGQPHYATVRNCILYGNYADTNGTIAVHDSGLTIEYSRYPVGSIVAYAGTVTYGPGNLVDAEPMFLDADGPDNIQGTLDDDPRIGTGSPCIDAGNGGSLHARDLFAGRRYHDGNFDGLTRPDMGAHEHGAPLWSPALYVRHDATGANNGASWADAFSGPLGLRRAQELCALDTGAFPQIWVAAGTYRPDVPVAEGGAGDRNATFGLFSGVEVYGGFAGVETSTSQRDIAANPTILSGDLNSNDNGDINRTDNSFHVVKCVGPGTAGVLDGFTIASGFANGPAPEDGQGAAILIQNSSPVVRSCRFIDHRAQSGGAVSIHYASSPLFVDCVFEGNQAYGFGLPINDTGGAVAIWNGANATFRRCTFRANSSANSGAAVVSQFNTLAAFVQCTFENNTATSGGTYLGLENSTAHFANCTFRGNTVGLGGGGAIWQLTGALSLTNCLMVGNSATHQTNSTGGALFIQDATTSIVNCTIAYNTATTHPQGSGAALHLQSLPSCTIANTVLWGNTSSSTSGEAAQLFVFANPPSISYSTIEGLQNFAGPGVNGAAPIFLRPPTLPSDLGDLRVGAGSPAIDSGNSLALPPDVYDLDSNGITNEAVPLDVAGGPRFVDDPNAPNTGPGGPPHVDRGCYENNLSTTVWANSAGGQWTLPSNWVNSVLPNSNTRVLFDETAGGASSSYAVQLPGDQHAYSMQVSANQVTVNARSGSFNGDLYLDAPTNDPNPSLLVSRTAATGLTPTLTITNSGGSTAVRRGLISGAIAVAREVGSRGALVVGDTNATNGQRTRLIATGTAEVGGAGAATLTLQSRALAQFESLTLAAQAGSSATATVAGASSSPSTLAYGGPGADLIIGQRGVATLAVGGALQGGPDPTRPGVLTSEGNPAGEVVIGDLPGSSGSVSVLGAGSMWVSEHSNFILGRHGQASLLVDGGQLITNTSNNIKLAAEPGSSALLELRNGASWTENGAGPIIGGAGVAEVRVDETSTISISGGPLRIDPAGALVGNGVITADVRNRGTIVPAVGADPLLISGSYEQVSSDPGFPYSGNIVLDVQGTQPGQYASVELAGSIGSVRLGGGIIVRAPTTLSLNTPLRLVTTPGQAQPFDVALLPPLLTAAGDPTNQYLRIEYGGDGADLGLGELRGSISFINPLDFPVPGQATDAAAADMDNDGLIDLVVTVPDGSSPGSAFIFFNAGDVDNDGQWDGFSGQAQVTTGVNPVALTVNNFDGMGGKDLAVANRGSGTVSVIYHTGLRTFGNALTFSVGSQPAAIDSAPINHSSELPGIAVAVGGSSPAALLMNNQQSSGNNFLFLPLPPLPTPVAPPPRRIRLPDLDQDKKSEVVLMGGDTLYPMHNDGTQMTWLAPLPVGAGAEDLRAADLDGNGFPDLVTANAGGGSISVVVNRSIVGAVELQPAVELPVGSGARSLAAVDLEGDGDADLAVIAEVAPGNRQVRLLRNDTEQEVQVVLSLADSRESGEGPLFVLAADVDGVGLDELITVNESDGGGGLVPNPEVVVNPNRGSVAPECGTADFDGDGDLGTDADIESFFRCLAGLCCETCYAGGADFNADGDIGTDADIESFFRVLAGGPC